MNIFLRISEEELGRFLLAYYRKVFGPLSLGKSFLLYYGLLGYEDIRHANDDDKALDLIKDEFLGRLS